MTPGARLAAAIEILDLHLGGQPLEKALTNWGRRSRFAGSKDRAAVRDIVFDRIRRRNSSALLGGGVNGRALVVGGLAMNGSEDALLSGEGHAPGPLSIEEQAARQVDMNAADWSARNDMLDWLRAPLEAALGGDASNVCAALTRRASVFVRVNLRKTTREEAISLLDAEGVEAKVHPLADTALEVILNPRKVAGSKAYADGLVEMQDAASQALCCGLPSASRMMDYCAGGGGKVLAYGALHNAKLYAHDANEQRLRDLSPRAKRAGVKVEIASQKAVLANAPFDLVLCDVPCSGSGSWRRSPEGKWRLTPDALAELVLLQRDILTKATSLVSEGGVLAFATCSLLRDENEAQVAWFLDNYPTWTCTFERRFSLLEGGDGFYVAHLTCGPKPH